MRTRFRQIELVGRRTQLKGIWGVWSETHSGGLWFRPDGWAPKVHMLSDGGMLCRGSKPSRQTTDVVSDVTCGSCLNMLTIKKWRMVMFLIAALIWASAQRGEQDVTA